MLQALSVEERKVEWYCANKQNIIECPTVRRLAHTWQVFGQNVPPTYTLLMTDLLPQHVGQMQLLWRFKQLEAGQEIIGIEHCQPHLVQDIVAAQEVATTGRFVCMPWQLDFMEHGA